ncbi:MAG TPA: exodeoxyribonuclease VII small subunit [Rhizomicrobium sp.]|nr:exodeoxyribonuclease VII small subunit [Rhizomicrobium sp.]
MRLWCIAVSGRNRNDNKLEPVIPSAKQDKAVEELSFEGALKELEAIVSRLEQGEVDLEDSIALYERGQALKSHCENKLKSAEGRLEKIVLGAGGEIAATEDGTGLETA